MPLIGMSIAYSSEGVLESDQLLLQHRQFLLQFLFIRFPLLATAS